MSFSNPIDISTPVSTENITQGDNRIRETKSGLQELLNVDHQSDLSGTEINSADSGTHRKTTLIEQASDPSAPLGVDTDFGILYTKEDDDTSQAELFWLDENDNVLQITKGNAIDLDSNYLGNNIYLEGTNGAEDDVIGMIKIDESDQVEIQHSETKPATLTDDSPPLVDKDIANKKYVDDAKGIIQLETVAFTSYKDCPDFFPEDDTIPQISEGTHVFSLAFTPISVNSRLIIEAVVTSGIVGQSLQGAGLFLSSQTNALVTTINDNSGAISSGSASTMVLKHIMTAGVDTEITFSVRGSNADVGGFSGARKWGGTLSSRITITEIAI
jgi:hypothetical protein